MKFVSSLALARDYLPYSQRELPVPTKLRSMGGAIGDRVALRVFGVRRDAGESATEISWAFRSELPRSCPDAGTGGRRKAGCADGRL